MLIKDTETFNFNSLQDLIHRYVLMKHIFFSFFRLGYLMWTFTLFIISPRIGETISVWAMTTSKPLQAFRFTCNRSQG